jgi:hypothetical protein
MKHIIPLVKNIPTRYALLKAPWLDYSRFSLQNTPQAGNFSPSRHSASKNTHHFSSNPMWFYSTTPSAAYAAAAASLLTPLL